MYDIVMFTGVREFEYYSSPLTIGAFKCAHELRLNGFSCLVVNHYHEFSITEILRLLDTAVGADTLFIGVSSTFMQDSARTSQDMDQKNKKKTHHCRWHNDYLFEQAIKHHVSKINPSTKMVIGGNLINKEFKSKVFDYAVVGYAETSIVDLAKFLKGTIDKLPHSYRNIYGGTIVDGSASNANYLLKESTMEWLPEDVVTHTILPIEIGRGCIFKCAFCSYPMNGQKTIDYNKNVDQIITELQFNYDNYGIFKYNIVDDTFNDSIEKLEALAAKISKLSFQPEFWCYARLDLICTHPESLTLLYKIGIRSMFFGIETLDRKSGQAIGKGYSRAKQIAMIAHIRKTYPDIDLHGSFIIGTPYESIESINLTIQQLLTNEIQLTTWYVQGLSIDKNSKNGDKISANYEDYGYTIDTDSIDEEHNNIHNRSIYWKNEHLTYKIAKDIADKANRSVQQDLNKIWRYSFDRGASGSAPRQEFVATYKQRLSEIIADKKHSLQ